LSEQLLSDYKKFEIALKQVYDLERILRRIQFKKISTPKNLYDECEELLKILNSTFILDSCAKFRKEQINENLFLEGIHPQIDKIISKKQKVYKVLKL